MVLQQQAGLLLTVFALPEPNQRSLEEVSGEHEARVAHEARGKIAVHAAEAV